MNNWMEAFTLDATWTWEWDAAALEFASFAVSEEGKAFLVYSVSEVSDHQNETKSTYINVKNRVYYLLLLQNKK